MKDFMKQDFEAVMSEINDGFEVKIYDTGIYCDSEAELYEKITGRPSTVFTPSKGQDK